MGNVLVLADFHLVQDTYTCMDAVEDVKSRLNIEDVVNEYVQLKRAGRNWKGLSPFTNERTPSFIVSPEKGIWHDFSSGKGGNMFSFVMEMEGLDFKGALELLARKAGVDLSQYQTTRSSQNSQLKERLYDALEMATRFYQTHLKSSQSTLDYVVKKRRFSRDIVVSFRLGYSPNNGSALIDFLTKKGFSEEEMQKAGLTARRYRGGIQDMFRGRLMVPLMDPQGRVIGFTARLLEDEPNAPKYINTPQTVLYDKGRHVFGLHLAKEAIRKSGFVVMVEGNLDVIASHQAGVVQVVATAGTALTEMHLKTISRFTGDVRLSFDQDAAGIAATERAIPIASKVRVGLSIVSIPSGKDPDELVRQDPKLWVSAIEKPRYALDWLVDKYRAQLDLTSAQGKRTFSDVLLRVIRQLPDEVEKEHYIDVIAKETGSSKQALFNKLRGIQSDEERRPRKKPKVEPVDAAAFDNSKTQDHFLALMLMLPGMRSELSKITDEVLVSEERKSLFAFLLAHQDFAGGPTEAPPELSKLADYVKILGLQYDELYRDREEPDLQSEAHYLRVELIKQYVKTKKRALSIQMSDADESETMELLEQVKKLDALLNQ